MSLKHYFGEPVGHVNDVTYFVAHTGKLWSVATIHGCAVWTHFGNSHAEVRRLRQSAHGKPDAAARMATADAIERAANTTGGNRRAA